MKTPRFPSKFCSSPALSASNRTSWLTVANMSGNDVRVSWPSASTSEFTLEQSATLAPASWIRNSARITDDGVKKSANLPATDSPQFLRLMDQR